MFFSLLCLCIKQAWPFDLGTANNVWHHHGNGRKNGKKKSLLLSHPVSPSHSLWHHLFHGTFRKKCCISKMTFLQHGWQILFPIHLLTDISLIPLQLPYVHPITVSVFSALLLAQLDFWTKKQDLKSAQFTLISHNFYMLIHLNWS